MGAATTTLLEAQAVRPPRGLPRLLAGLPSEDRAVTLHEHLKRYGQVAVRRDLIEEVEASGLRGRGGAGFPTGAKLRAVAASSKRRDAVVLVNAVEGESASGKDKALLGYVPHLVLDGAVCAARALGSREIVVAVSDTARATTARLAQALRDRELQGIDGAIKIRIAAVPDGFVSGEETAVINVLNGGPAKPTFTPPRPSERGVRRAPTLVQNPETLANLALVARFGASWFREIGTEAEPGSMLVTVSGAVAERGVYELEVGAPMRALVDAAGGSSEPLRAFLVGGYFGSWVDATVALGLRLLDDDLRHVGASLGARAVVALPVSGCGVCETARTARYLADQSAGQCGPCVHGLAAIASALEQISTGHGADRREQLLRWAREIRGRGACRHPDGAARFVASALTVFADEVEAHLRDGHCRASRTNVLPLPSLAERL
jgi:NADH:ubiquinone oxidoreductase subunit F (NADH-binding)